MLKEKKVVRVYNIALVTGFLAVLLIPLFTLGYRDESLLENRRLASFPKLPSGLGELARFADGFEAYVNDQYGYREEMILLDNRLSRSLGVLSTEKVIEGRDGWLFYAGDERSRPLDDYLGINLFTPMELERWTKTLVERRRLLEREGIEYAFVVVPNKMEIYREYLPDGYAYRSGISRAEQLARHVGEHSQVDFLLLTESLRKGRDEATGMALYGKTGTHWNAFGAGLGYNRIAGWLEGTIPRLRLKRYGASDFRIESTAPDRDLQRMLEGEVDGFGPGPVLRDGGRSPRWREGPVVTSGEAGPYALQFASGGGDGTGTLLVFGDSFFNELAPFLFDAFGTIYFAPSRPTTEEVLEGVELTACDVVMEQRVERYLWRFPDWGN